LNFGFPCVDSSHHCSAIPQLVPTCTHTHSRTRKYSVVMYGVMLCVFACVRVCAGGDHSATHIGTPTYHLTRQRCRRKYVDEELTSRCGTDPGRDRTSISSGTSSTSVSSSVSVSPGSWLRVLRAPAPIWYPAVRQRTGGAFQKQDSC